MENKRVRAKVIMLPTENKSLLHIHSELSTGSECMGGFETLKLTDSKTKFEDPDWDGNIPQHLYFTTDEEIKEGDWYMVTDFTKPEDIRQATKYLRPEERRRNGYKKIIATTDESLHIPYVTPGNEELEIYEYKILPKPSQAFIEKYVELCGIQEVDIEYESYIKGQCNCQCHDDGTVMLHIVACCHPTIIYQPVKNSNNIITIYSVKDSWSREEHINNLIKYRNAYEQYKRSCHFGPNEVEISKWSNQWIEENL